MLFKRPFSNTVTCLRVCSYMYLTQICNEVTEHLWAWLVITGFGLDHWIY
jgi:hypothetical protein